MTHVTGPDGQPRAQRLPPRARRLVVAAYVLLCAAVAMDLLQDPQWTVSPVLATAPVLASIGSRRPFVPLFVGLGALALVGPLVLADDEVPLTVHLTSGFTVLAITSVSTANVLLVATRERELLQSRSVAEAAQHTLLRPPPERLDGLRVAVRYLAAAAEARVGGDLYEVLVTPYGTRLLMGDVRGKGLAAIDTAAAVLGTFREAAQVEPSLAAVAGRLDAAMGRRRPGEEFVTAVLVEVAGPGRAEMVNCGHLPPLRCRPGRSGPEVDEVPTPEPQPPLALLGMAGGAYRGRAFAFERGDLLLLYTDGVTEARDAAGRFYPLADRLATLHETAPAALLDRVVADLLAYAGGELSDDAALLAVRREH
ncbi:PP2C family protein-serine/threonine phosphatase [Streptomyces sp. NPDC008001]|uniref:PP2C family protein-serine/threonine phosphatase n=1 Tax=Streptomyces sp. NPDC008001 TaxID=3364804 RepID=UPI0036E63E47